MPEIPVWEVSLTVYGSITVEKTLRFSEFKGFRFHDPFYSDIEIRRNRSTSGIEAGFLLSPFCLGTQILPSFLKDSLIRVSFA